MVDYVYHMSVIAQYNEYNFTKNQYTLDLKNDTLAYGRHLSYARLCFIACQMIDRSYHLAVSAISRLAFDRPSAICQIWEK